MGSLEDDYLYDFDNNYRILAHHIVSNYRPSDVLRCLTDNLYLKNLIIKETRQQDLAGPFTDCLIESILEEKDRMEWMHTLDAVGNYLYSRLDKGRLRDEILIILNKAGVEI